MSRMQNEYLHNQSEYNIHFSQFNAHLTACFKGLARCVESDAGNRVDPVPRWFDTTN